MRVARSSVEEQEMYEPLRIWLRSQGFRAITAHGRKGIGIWVGDILPGRAYIEPDVVGIRDSPPDTVCIEAKSKVVDLFELVGKCKVWQLATRHVFLAVPQMNSLVTEGLESLGIGVLFVKGNQVSEIVKPEPYHAYVGVDEAKNQELFNQAYRAIKAQHAFLEIHRIEAKSHSKSWSISFEVENIGSKTNSIEDFLFKGRSSSESRIKAKPRPSKEKPLPVHPGHKLLCKIMVPKNEELKEKTRYPLDLKVTDGIEKGREIYLPSARRLSN